MRKKAFLCVSLAALAAVQACSRHYLAGPAFARHESARKTIEIHTIWGEQFRLTSFSMTDSMIHGKDSSGHMHEELLANIETVSDIHDDNKSKTIITVIFISAFVALLMLTIIYSGVD
jgi:hypothetical protein